MLTSFVFVLFFLPLFVSSVLVQISTNIRWFKEGSEENSQLIGFVNSNFPTIVGSRVQRASRDIGFMHRSFDFDISQVVSFNFSGRVDEIWAVGVFFFDDRSCMIRAPVVSFDGVIHDMSGFRLERYGSKMSRTRAFTVVRGVVELCPEMTDAGVLWIRDPPADILPAQSADARPPIDLVPAGDPLSVLGGAVVPVCLDGRGAVVGDKRLLVCPDNSSSANVPAAIVNGSVEVVFQCLPPGCPSTGRLLSLEVPYSYRTDELCTDPANVSEWRCFEQESSVLTLELQNDFAFRVRFKSVVSPANVDRYNDWPRDIDSLRRPSYYALLGFPNGTRFLTVENAFTSRSTDPLDNGTHHVLVTWDSDVMSFYVNGTWSFALSMVGPLAMTGRVPFYIGSSAPIAGTTTVARQKLRAVISRARLLFRSVSRAGAAQLFQSAFGLASPTTTDMTTRTNMTTRTDMTTSASSATDVLPLMPSPPSSTIGIALGVTAGVLLFVVAAVVLMLRLRRRKLSQPPPPVEQQRAIEQRPDTRSSEYGELKLTSSYGNLKLINNNNERSEYNIGEFEAPKDD